MFFDSSEEQVFLYYFKKIYVIVNTFKHIFIEDIRILNQVNLDVIKYVMDRNSINVEKLMRNYNILELNLVDFFKGVDNSLIKSQ